MDRYNFRNYDEYRSAQIEANKKKIQRNWANEAEMRYLADWLRLNRPTVKSGVCHGARNGKEAEWLSKHTGAKIIAADISPTILDFGGVQWDFHEKNPEWSGVLDVVYCNALDHAYDANMAVEAMLDSLSPNGVLVLQWTPCGHRDFYPNKIDCFAANLREYKMFCNQHGKLVETLKSKDIRKADKILMYHLIVKSNPAQQGPRKSFKLL